MFAIILISECPNHSCTSFSPKPLLISRLAQREIGYAEDCACEEARKTCTWYSPESMGVRPAKWIHNRFDGILCRTAFDSPLVSVLLFKRSFLHRPYSVFKVHKLFTISGLFWAFLNNCLQMLSYEKACLWGYPGKNAYSNAHQEAHQSLTATLRGKKRHIVSKKVSTLLPRHFDCETARVSVSFPSLLYSNFFESKAKPKCVKSLWTLLFRLRPINLQWKPKMHTLVFEKAQKKRLCFSNRSCMSAFCSGRSRSCHRQYELNFDGFCGILNYGG